MAAANDEFRSLLEAGDVIALRRAWARVARNLPQPASYEQAEIVMHLTRTGSVTVRFECRAWSHRWLTERNLPSQLPDIMRPSAERMYPTAVEAVGISVNFKNPWLRAAGDEIRTAMEHAVLEADADGRITDAVFVRSRMAEARAKTERALFGNILSPGVKQYG